MATTDVMTTTYAITTTDAMTTRDDMSTTDDITTTFATTTTDELTTTAAMTTTDGLTTLSDNSTNNKGFSEDSPSITTENLVLMVVGSVGALAVVAGISVCVAYTCSLQNRKSFALSTI